MLRGKRKQEPAPGRFVCTILPLTTADWTHVATDPSLATLSLPRNLVRDPVFLCARTTHVALDAVTLAHSIPHRDQRSRETGVHVGDN